jgi:hypothetical protein
MKLLVLLMLLFGIGFSSNEMSHDCLSYESATVMLKGEISRKTFPGRPNYESIEEGDEPETYWILHLTNPICVNGDESIPNGENPEKDVSDIQLGLDEEQYVQYKDLLGNQVVVSGKLSHAITGHHHTNVLLKVAEIKGELASLGSNRLYRTAQHNNSFNPTGNSSSFIENLFVPQLSPSGESRRWTAKLKFMKLRIFRALAS